MEGPPQSNTHERKSVHRPTGNRTGGGGSVEFQEVIGRRRSIRVYSEESVDPAALDRVLRAVSRAPSAGNLQAYRISVVGSPRKRQALAVAAGDQAFLAQAPLDLVFFADPDRSAAKYGRRGASLYAVQDATIAATFAVLAATNEALSTVWVGAFDESAVRAVCGETKLRPVAIIAVGHGAEDPRETARRDREETVREL
jgi:nitroreductase